MLVIATGGSAVYSDQAMRHLKRHGLVVFLDVSLATVEQRIGDFSLRGISKRKDQSIAELFSERYALYKQYADVAISGDDFSQDQICAKILRSLAQNSAH
jgi:shikimate kinase